MAFQKVFRWYPVSLIFMAGTSLLSQETESGNSEPFETKPFKIGEVAVTVNYLDADAAGHHEELCELASRTFRHFTDYFGGLPRDLEGKDYTEFTMNVDSTKLHGEADPKRLDLGITDGKIFGFADWRTGLIHEMLHLWNSETFRYADGREQWFNEGATEYITFKTAIEFGLIEQEDAVTRLMMPWGNYLAARDVGRISLREAGASKEKKRAHYFLVYHGGFVISMLLDFDIRVTTKNEKSLDDLMRWLFENFDRSKGEYYNMEALNTGLEEITGKDYAKMFELFVDGPGIIPIGRFVTREEIHVVRAREGKGMDPVRTAAIRGIFGLR